MKYISHLVILCFMASVGISTAGTNETVDARTFMTPIVTAAKTDQAQVTAFENAFNMQHAAARSVFESKAEKVTLTNVDIPLHGISTLELERTVSVFDATSEIVMAAPNGGRRPIKVRPIQSFKGTVNGDPNSWVTLHYSEGDLTGFIQHSDGTRTVVTRANEMRASKDATPHVLADENSSPYGPALKDFTCGNELLPEDEKAAVTSMLVPSSLKKGETIQQLELTEIRLAIVLREDIFTELSRRGYDEERTAQHFAKIVASMSQAYEQDIRARMFISFMLIFSEDIPSGYFSNGLNPGDLLDEFSRDWSSSYNDVERTVAHLYTRKISQGGSFVGGIAYGGQAGTRLCVKNHRGAYGVSTMDLAPESSFPGAANSRNGYVWDVFVASHEIGHNVGSPHTHNCFWNPPVDTCQIKSDGTDACYDSGRRTRPGTIMSYCHLVNGSSTPLTFGPKVSERMRSWMDQSCMTAPETKTVSITSPRGPETWAGGEQMTIKFVSHRVDNVNLDYSLDGGSVWKEIVQDLPAVDTQYVWVLPNVGTTNLAIRISDASDASVNYVSLATYTINVPLSISSPTSGDRLGSGYDTQIQYKKDVSIPTVDIYYSLSGDNWMLIEENVSASNYKWNVVDAVTSEARIRVVSSSNDNIFAISDMFSIGEPTYRLLLPAEGATICNNFDNQFNWSGDFIDKVRIQYSTDGGSSWKNALQPLTVEVQQWQIFSRNNGMGSLTPGTEVQLQVVESVTRDVLDTRDKLIIGECDQVTSVTEETNNAGSFRIVSVTPNPASTTVTLTMDIASSVSADVLAVDASGASVTLASGIELFGGAETNISVPVDKLTSGAYRIVVRAGSVVTDAPLRVIR